MTTYLIIIAAFIGGYIACGLLANNSDAQPPHTASTEAERLEEQARRNTQRRAAWYRKWAQHFGRAPRPKGLIRAMRARAAQ